MRLSLWLLVALLLGTGGLWPQDDASTVFATANEQFRQANAIRSDAPDRSAELYRSAALRYESLVAEREIRNSKLYYNLANAHFQLGDIGRAILNYRRAERLDPGDDNVRRNLQFARSRRLDRLDASRQGQVVRTLLFWHYEFGRFARVRLFAAMWLGLWAVLLLRALGNAWVPRELAYGFGVAAALILGSLAFDAMAERNTVAGVVVVQETVARQGDGATYEASFEEPLHSGAEFRILEERPGWYRVALPDGRRCWLSAVDVELVR